MADTIITRILADLVTTLRGITKDNGYSREVRHVSETAVGPDQPLRDSITVAGLSEHYNDADAGSTQHVTLTVLLGCLVEENDNLPKAIHDLAADIKKIVETGTSYNRGGLAIDTKVKDVAYDIAEDLRPLADCVITLEIPYKHKHGDPRSSA